MILQKNLMFDNSTLNNFKNWAQGISEALTACDLGQTTDTGQVDWATAAIPTTTLNVVSSQAYEIWSFSDSLATACPVFIKVEYGVTGSQDNSSNPIVSCPAIIFTIGTGTDGAGAIIGNKTPRINPFQFDSMVNKSGSGSTVFECDFSGTSGRLGMMLWKFSPYSTSPFIGIERSVDINGNYTADYVTVLVAGVNCIYQYTLMAPSTGGVSTQGGVSGVWVTPTVLAATTGFGNASAFLPVFPLLGRLDNPLTIAGMVKTGDQSEGAVFNIQLYGGTKTYLYSKQTQFANIGVGANNGIAMRWD